MLVGQKKLKAWLDSYTLQTLPRTIMFIGEKGCGKHWFAADIASRFEIRKVIIDDSITHDQLVEYSQSVIPTLYVIDLTCFDEKAQNKFLKFIEEPSIYAHIILTATSEIGVLPTVLNRCIKIHFEQYSVDELKKFSWISGVDDSLVGLICRTPGQVISINAASLVELSELCKKIVAVTRLATYPNFMKLTTKFNFKEEYDKYDFETFLNILEYTAFNDFKTTNANDSLAIYLTVNEAKQNAFGKKLNLEAQVTNFFTKLWEAVQQ